MKFNLNDKDLKRNYRMLVAQWHPDRFTKSVKEQVKAQETSIQVNKAFQTLKDPLKRSHYLLKLYDYEITEHTRLNDPDFLLQVMEIQEEIVQGQGLREMQKENDQRIQKSIEILSDLFDVKQDYKMAQKEAIKLNYYYTITKLIQDF
jgi:molecular chaperone HscB